jgi:hypothetical protein
MGTQLDLDDVAGSSELAIAELKELRDYINTLKAGIEAVSYLIGESSGVYVNGNLMQPMDWDDMLNNSWLEDFKKAEQAKEPVAYY